MLGCVIELETIRLMGWIWHKKGIQLLQDTFFSLLKITFI